MANWAARALAAGFFLAGALPAAATELWFCNNTNKPIYIAVAYYNTDYGDWYLYAYENIYENSCNSLFNIAPNDFYYYVFNEDRSLHWPADQYASDYYCIPNEGVNRRMVAGECRRGEQRAPFYQDHASGQRYTVNINP